MSAGAFAQGVSVVIVLVVWVLLIWIAWNRGNDNRD